MKSSYISELYDSVFPQILRAEFHTEIWRIRALQRTSFELRS